MRPLRPHNYYGGTTCPGRVTSQVPTIRSLIPAPPVKEADDMFLFVRNPAGTIAIVGELGKRPLTLSEWKAWTAKGSVSSQLSDADYNVIPNAGVPSDRGWLSKQLDWMWRHLLQKVSDKVDAAHVVTRSALAPLVIYATPSGQQVGLGPYRCIVTSDALRELMARPHLIINKTDEQLAKIELFPSPSAGGPVVLSAADIGLFTAAVRQELDNTKLVGG